MARGRRRIVIPAIGCFFHDTEEKHDRLGAEEVCGRMKRFNLHPRSSFWSQAKRYTGLRLICAEVGFSNA